MQPEPRLTYTKIDGAGLYGSRIVGAGPLAFFSATATTPEGELHSSAAVSPPYSGSKAAHVVHQSRAIFEDLSRGLDSVGSSLSEVLLFEQFNAGKAYADGYITVRGEFIPENRPTTAMAQAESLIPGFCVITSGGIALRGGFGLSKEIPSGDGEEQGGDGQGEGQADGEAIDWSVLGKHYRKDPYNPAVIAGPYRFLTGDVAMDPATGDVDPSIKIPNWIWAGNEARNEAELLLARLEGQLHAIGSDLDHLAHVSLFMTDIGDLFEVDRAWREVFGDNPPARTVIPVSGLGVPRWEGRNQGHRDSAIRLEQQCRAVEKGTRREVIRVTPGEFGCEAEAVLAGDYLWISNQYAYRAPGSQTPGSPDEEVSVIFARLEQLCRKAQGSFGDIAQVRAFVSDKEAAAAFFTALRREFPEAPPSASAVVLPAPLAVPDARIFVDAVAHIPGPA